jgi:hypothetical protein
MTVVNPKSISGINSITTGSGSDNLLTIHTSDANNTERLRIDSTGTTKIVTGIVTTLTATSSAKVGSGITLSPDGDVFATGVCTATTFSGSGASLTNLPAANLTGALPAISGANLTGLQAGKFVTDGIGITTATPVGIETTSIARKDLAGPAGNTSTGAGSSFHGAYMGDGFLSFNTEFSNPTGYYISTFTNALVSGPMQLGTTLTIDGNFTIV